MKKAKAERGLDHSKGGERLKPRVLYLDQNAWIALAKGAWDKEAHPREHAALTVVVHAIQADHIIVPMSFANQYETRKIDIPVRRASLANVQATISGGRVLRSRRRLLEVMLLRRITEATGVEVELPTGHWFLSDLWLEASGELSSGAFEGVVSDAVVAYLRQRPKETLFDYLVGSDEALRKEAVRRYSAESEALLARIAVRRERLVGESFALRLRAYGAQLLLDEIDYILAMGRGLGLPWSRVGDIGASLAKSLVTDVPIMEAERQLVVRLEDQSRTTNENDLRDMAAFTAALPLVDIIVGEKQFVNLSRQAKLDTRYGTTLLTSVEELTPQLLNPDHADV